MNKIKKLPKGIYTATLTPLKKDNTIDFGFLVAHCRRLLTKGSKGIVLLGTTGEANSFTIQERKDIVEAVIKGGISAEKIMVGTGCCALQDAVDLTTHALSHGIVNMLFMPPFYYKVSDEGITQFFDAFITAVNNEQLRLYLYHFPKMTDTTFNVPTIKRLKEKYPNEIAGIKDSSASVAFMTQLIEEVPDFQVFSGSEMHLLKVLQLGGAGAISATANVSHREANAVVEAWEKGEAAEPLQAYLTNIRKSFQGFPFTGGLKTYLAARDDEPRWLKVRLPNLLLSEKIVSEIQERLKKVGYQE